MQENTKNELLSWLVIHVIFKDEISTEMNNSQNSMKAPHNGPREQTEYPGEFPWTGEMPTVTGILYNGLFAFDEITDYFDVFKGSH